MSEMRAFSVRGIPVSFSIWYVLLLLFLAANQSPQDALIAAVVVTFSILVHEFGHALVAAHYGLRPSVVLHGLGGLCRHDRARSVRHQTRIVAAGPGAGLALGVAVYLLAMAINDAQPNWLAEHPAAHSAVRWLLFVNIVWSVINLLPIWPLDGGQLFQIFLHNRMPARQAHIVTHKAAIGLAGLAFVWSLLNGYSLVPLIAGLIIWENYSRLRTGRTDYQIGATGGAGHHAATEHVSRSGHSWLPTPAVQRILFINIGVWLALVVVGGSNATWVYAHLHLSSSDVLSGQVWQLFTYFWLHDPSSLAHVMMNMLGLVLLGPFVERRWGSRAFFQFYIWAGLIAGVVTLVAAKLSPELFGTPVIGASGAVIAVVAAISFSYPKEQLGLFLVIPMEARWAVWLLAGLDTLFFFSNPHSDLAYQTHMGGILAGYLLVTGNWRPSKLSALFSGSKTPPRRSHLRVVPKDEDDEPPRYLH